MNNYLSQQFKVFKALRILLSFLTLIYLINLNSTAYAGDKVKVKTKIDDVSYKGTINVNNGTKGQVIQIMPFDKDGETKYRAEWSDLPGLTEGEVNSSHILDESIQTNDLKNDSITSDKISDGTIANSDLSNNVITSDKLMAGAVTGAKLASESVTASKISTGTLPSTFTVSQNGDADYNDIQSAIDALSSTGGKIIIREGTYTITDTITISNSNTIIEGMGPSTIIKSNTIDTLLKVESPTNQVTINNLSFELPTNSESAIEINNTHNIAIQHCLFSATNSSKRAIKVLDSQSITIQNNTFTGTYLHNDDTTNVIYLDNTSSSILTTNHFYISNTDYIIRGFSCNNIIISDSIIQAMGSYPNPNAGIYFSQSSSINIQGNDIQAISGIYLGTSGNNNIISNNYIKGSDIRLLEISSDYTVIEGNTIVTTGSYAIACLLGDYATITSNVITSASSTDDSIYLGTLSTNCIVSNNIVNGDIDSDNSTGNHLFIGNKAASITVTGTSHKPADLADHNFGSIL